MIDIASLNQRIEIQQLTSTKDSRGNPEKAWTTLGKRWAKADISSGTAIYTRHERQSATAGYDGPEFYGAAQNLVETKVMFEMRYNKKYEMIDTTEYRIIWKKRIYSIKSVSNENGRNEKLIITAICKDSNNSLTEVPSTGADTPDSSGNADNEGSEQNG